ncbi:MAG TPA: tyrosine-type recombinase/integrase, partial [Gemmatimonadales bacterium]|nr:tyrosine-type recombinase/integrase [Gemmatimonadales bacterium]
RRLPVVLTRDEVRSVLKHMEHPSRLVAALLYGSGLRLLEGLQLRVKDLDFASGELRVRMGKGQRDRVPILPARLQPALTRHLEVVKRQHEHDRAMGLVGSSSRLPWLGSTPELGVNGGGSGFSRRLGSTSTRPPENEGAITSTKVGFSGLSTTR